MTLQTNTPTIPAPIIIDVESINEYFAQLDKLIFLASQKPIGAPPCKNAVKYGVRTAYIKTTFGFKVPVKVQRYKCPSGKTVSTNPLVIPGGLYDIRIVYTAVMIYTLGVSAEDTAALINWLLGANVSARTVLEWVKYIGSRGFEEHRKILEDRINAHVIKHVMLDELYMSTGLDSVPYAIVLLVDPNTSLIIDVYVFRGSQITTFDVKAIIDRNDFLFGGLEFITTDGAKAYKSVRARSRGHHIICLQHITRNKRKQKRVKVMLNDVQKYLEDLVYQYADELATKYINELERLLNFVLPSVTGSLEKFKAYMISKARESINRILEDYRVKLKERMDEVFQAYVHRWLYTAQHAALVGKLFNEFRRREKRINSASGITINILRYSSVASTTAVVEGLNRLLRERIRKAHGYRDKAMVEAIAKLIALNHNTRVLYGGKTPYELIGIDADIMEYNPFKVLGKVSERCYRRDFIDEAGLLVIRREVYRRYKKKTVHLKIPPPTIPSVDDAIDWAIWARDNLLLGQHL